ncbi:hypothetical protein VP1G_01849 [Cytospora mali]|uniref:Heterokaryon incompatibility domain-containing protein n=1 Tax=Cytospora mali TaxID=578113 RepID=A0A194US22_CYTMA|nr:hypothetical protein VP1G_01849 [Valsa mali var. pyri (nom. inval.)]
MSSEFFTTEKHWPLRLLRLDGNAFKSVQRSGPSTYEGTKLPNYNILSYTWGRWQTEVGEALPIQNVKWKIPIVARQGFSVEAFAKVVRHVSQGSHVWLDVGCIDQEDEAVKMGEIGKQAAIFRGAQKAYIWLSHSKRNILKPFILEVLSRDAHFIDRPWLNKVSKGIEIIFADPWFSSLWTLQEGFIRLDAIILFDDASWLDIPKFESYSGTGGPCTLRDIVKAYEHISSSIRGILQYYPDRLGHEGNNRARRVCQRLDEVGIPCLARSHAIALYGVSSFRNPTRQHDRIYGIMQVFGLVLGKSAHPHKDFTLSDLEDQLGEAVNKANPVLAQWFVHLDDPRPNRRWCLHRNMRVYSYSPVVGRALEPPTPYCRIVFEPSRGFAKFQGHKALFGDLTFPLKFSFIYFDETTENRSKLPGSFFITDALLGDRAREVEGALEKSFGKKTSVLLIGGLGSPPVWEWLGVIAYPVSVSGYPGKTFWARIGICIWSYHIDQMREELWDLFPKETVYLV